MASAPRPSWSRCCASWAPTSTGTCPIAWADGYGLAAATVERLAARGTKLLITADCAITAVEQVAQARAAGIEVLVTDHHSPREDGVLPDAPYVHPLLCGYPCPDLCATAVAAKLSQALRERAGLDGGERPGELELVALATVADVMALRGENRRLVREGLSALSATIRPGLRALMASRASSRCGWTSAPSRSGSRRA